MDLHLKDKIVVISGGSSGIGAGISEVFAREGAKVCFTYHGTNPAGEERAKALKKRLDETYGSDCCYVPVECEKEDQVAALFDAAEKYFGGTVQILCNNAGITAKSGIMPDITTEQWNAFIAGHMTNYFIMSREFAKRVIAAKLPGWIVNTLSKASLSSATKGGLCVVANKAAEWGMTHAMAVDMTDYNIHVNGVMPGYVDNGHSNFNPALTAKRMERVPIHRMAEPIEIGNMVAFLASDQCQLAVGTCVDVTGGLLLGF
ncbi:MAG: SDR family oxidoreductase [Lachnospiraceae bacterium]|nr:SDR family oxidoreductase [Lachnospiraceae bacterium]